MLAFDLPKDCEVDHVLKRGRPLLCSDLDGKVRALLCRVRRGFGNAHIILVVSYKPAWGSGWRWKLPL